MNFGNAAQKRPPLKLATTAKAAEGPFPWSTACGPEDNPNDEPMMAENDFANGSCTTPELPNWVASLPETLQSNPGLLSIAQESRSMSFMEFQLPKPDVVAGRVLQHCVNVVNNTFSKFDPCIFKLGFTHNPCWRWNNDIYGYKLDRARWSNMIVLYISGEPFGPAMLEAVLIHQYHSVQDALCVVQNVQHECWAFGFLYTCVH